MPEFIDITGQKFGDWTVLEYLGNQRWLCECSCENHTRRAVLGKTLRNGKSKSCGHSTNQFKDLTGQEFGKWKVIEFTGDGRYKCQCSCEDKTVKIIDRASLVGGSSTNCGCVRRDKLVERNQAGRIKLEGKHIGEWDVIKYLGDKHYLCQCSCGKFKSVAGRDLREGISTSCGHNNGRNLIKDITGQKFGELTVKRYLGHKIWECECSCENHTIVQVRKGNLLNGSTRSCGCKRYDRLSKEDIMSAIDKYKEANNELPFIKDLSDILDRHEAHIRRYIKNYELEQYINKKFDSRAERDIYNMFGNDKRVLLHSRDVITPQELDIYIPEKKLAIEFNGTYWHSDIYKDKKYHQQKTLACARKNIQLIHIFEYEWEDEEKRRKIVNYINKLCGNTDTIKIGARELEVKKVNSMDTCEFLDKYHLQKSAKSEVNIGAYHKDELIGVMTFGKPRFNSNYEYEIHRLCWNPKYAVSGGTERLFRHFVREYKPKSIITYSDISKFTGNVYTRIGFNVIKEKPITDPNYVWVNTRTNDTLTRYQTMKHILIEEGLGLEDQTEDEIMNNLGYLKVYDSGNMRLEWKES